MNAALAFGFISLFGFSGFAQASEVTDLIKEEKAQFAQIDKRGNDIMAVVIAGQISDVHFRYCTAIKAGNTDSVWALGNEQQEKLDAYWSVAQRRYNLQPCP